VARSGRSGFGGLVQANYGAPSRFGRESVLGRLGGRANPALDGFRASREAAIGSAGNLAGGELSFHILGSQVLV
jgi:hypothetical protein